jgi:hypothetical protein
VSRLYMKWSRNSIKKKLRVIVTIHFGAIKQTEKLPMVFTQGKGLKLDPFKFSTHSLGLPISNPEGSIFQSFSCIFGFCSFLFGPPLLYTFHRFSSFSSLLLCEVVQHMLYKYNNEN